VPDKPVKEVNRECSPHPSVLLTVEEPVGHDLEERMRGCEIQKRAGSTVVYKVRASFDQTWAVVVQYWSFPDLSWSF
jgi:hypothetical protein